MTVVFDIETKLVYNQQVPHYLGYLHEDALGIVDSPDCVEQLVEIFKDGDYYEYNFYAHNFSGFDSYFITPALLKKKGTIVKMFVKNSKIMFIKCYFESTTFYFRDTFLYTNLPLLEIYKMIGWKKKFLTNFSRKNLYSYLAFDLVGLYYVLLWLRHWSVKSYRIDITNCVSIAQFSYRVYKKRFMKKRIHYLNYNMRILLQPHFGGNKIHITQNYGKNLFFYDVNSMYPFAMLKPLPNKYKGVSQNGSLDVFFGFVSVSVISRPQNTFHFSFEKAIVFSEEVKMLIKIGYKFKLHYFIRFSQQRLFSKYVNHFYHIRRYSTFGLTKAMMKLCLNSLYGKLATRASRRNSLQLAMAINSYSRAEMVGYKQKEFIYADTDSVVYPFELSHRYLGKEIGLMKLVAKIDEGYFIPNYYRYTSGKTEVIKAKGMIKKVLPKLDSLLFSFKLTYYKKKKYAIYLHETFFKFKYSINNVRFYHQKKSAGTDFFGWLG